MYPMDERTTLIHKSSSKNVKDSGDTTFGRSGVKMYIVGYTPRLCGRL